MARIEPYESNVEAPGPVGGLSPNLDEATAVGRSLSALGSQVDQAADIVYKKQEQTEAVQAYSAFAKYRADAYGKIQKGVEDETLDPDKVMDDYNNFVDSQSENYTTAGGKNQFLHQAARLQSSLQIKASGGYAHVQGQQTADMVDQATGDGRTAIQLDPSQFQDTLQAGNAFLDSQDQANGGKLNSALIAKGKAQMAEDYSYTAIRATAQTSPDAAQKLLDSGAFTKYLDNQGMSKAQTIITQAQMASRAQANFAAKQESDAQSAQDDSTQKSYLQAIHSGQFNAGTAFKDPSFNQLSFSQQNQIFNAAEQASKRDQEFRPAVFNGLMKRVESADTDVGHISSDEQLIQMMASGRINPAEARAASVWLAKDPETKLLNAQVKNVMTYATKTLSMSAPLVQGLPGVKDPDGDYKTMLFRQAVNQKRAEFLQANPPGQPGSKPVSTLFDPKAPEFVGNMVPQFQMTHDQVIRRQAQSRVDSAVSAPSATPTQINNAPGTPVPAPAAKSVAAPRVPLSEFFAKKKTQ